MRRPDTAARSAHNGAAPAVTDAGRERLDLLRRRLYAPGATEADAERYRAAAGGPQPSGSSSIEDVPAWTPQKDAVSRARLARIRVAALGVLCAVVLLVTGIALTRPAPPVPVARLLPATTVTVPDAARAEFVRRLEGGGSAAFSDFLLQHPGFRPPQLTTLTRAATEEHDATGTRAVALDPSALADRGGRMTVVLIVAGGGTARWRASRLATRADHSQYLQEVAAQRTTQPAGVPVSTTFRYTGTAPTLLSVDVAAGVRWDAVVVFSD